MNIRQSVLDVLQNYERARTESFSQHPVAIAIRKSLADAVKSALPPSDGPWLVKGSAGQGNWARGPWVAVFNPLVTDSAQRGFYPVYLFAEDMSGVYLSLNQAMTEARELYQSDAKTALRARAANFRAMLGKNIMPFDDLPIDLAASNPGADTAFYEAGNICSVFYPANAVPSDEKLVAHLHSVLKLYDVLIESGEGDSPTAGEDGKVFLEGGASGRFHLRVERNRRLVAEVKKKQGLRCRVCDLNFSETYGVIGESYIEAHHLVPIASLKNGAVPLDPVRDFAVLCANCHRMAHRLPDPSDLSVLKAIFAN